MGRARLSGGRRLRHLGATSLFAALLAACGGEPQSPSSQTAPWPTLNGAAPIIIAHRGASGLRPEHTLEAYALAIEQGADAIEPDLVITKDGALVARHDRYLSTTTNVADVPSFADRRRPDPDPAGSGRTDWWVEDFTLAEIKSLRARQPFKGRDTSFDDRFEIPTLDEVISLAEREAAARGREIGLYPETKSPGFFASIGLEFDAPLVAALNGYAAGPIYLQSFEPDILKRLADRAPGVRVQLVFEKAPGSGSNISLEDIATYADGVGAQKSLLAGDASAAEPGYFISKAHSLGIFVHAWTYRDDQPPPASSGAAPLSPEDEIASALRWGVDGIFTDFPSTGVAARALATASD